MTPSNSGPKPVDQEAPPKRRRSWGRVVAFLTLASLVVLAVMVFSSERPPTYRFLSAGRQTLSEEMILKGIWLHDTLIQRSEYTSGQSPESLIERVQKEVDMKGWSADWRGDREVNFEHPSDGKFIYISSPQNQSEIVVGQSRPATILDRVRIWFRSLGKSSDREWSPEGYSRSNP